MCPWVHVSVIITYVHVYATLKHTHIHKKKAFPCGVSLRLHIFQIPEAVKAPCVQKHANLPHLYDRKSTAKRPPAFFCHGYCPNPREGQQPLPSILTTHAQRNDTHGHTVQWGKTGPWPLCLGPNLDEDTKLWWQLYGGTGRTQRRSSSALTQRQKETTTTENLLPLSRKWSWGPLSNVRHNTSISIHRHLSR